MSSMKEQILETLAMLVWTSTEEIAAQVGRHRTTVLRHLRELHEAGLVGFRLFGRSPTVLQCWLLWSDGVYHVFPVRYRHPGQRDRHRHDPKSEHNQGHSHPSFWNTQTGAKELWESGLHLLRFLYPLAINLFKGEYAQFHPQGIEAKLLNFRWLEHGQLVRAVAEYEGGIVVFFAWVPLDWTDSMLKHRWNHRLDKLIVRSSDDDEPFDWMTPSDPNLDGAPKPSLTVVNAEDLGAAVVARRALVDGIRMGRGTRPFPFLMTCLSDPAWRHLEGRILPSTDNVWNPAHDYDLGSPDKLCEPRKEDDDGC